jgi:hypothetical protein
MCRVLHAVEAVETFIIQNRTNKKYMVARQSLSSIQK